MRDINPRPGVRPEAFHFTGAMNGGSFACSTPRSPFSDAEEMELASKLLHVTSEAELEQALGDLFKKAWRGIDPAGSKAIGPLGGFLKTAAQKALPSLAAATRTSFDEPPGMSAANRDLEKCRNLFEKYRQFVRLAGKATRAAASPPMGVPPLMVAKKILVDSAKEKLTENLTRKAAPAARAGKFAEGVQLAAAMKPAATAGRTVTQKPRTGPQAPGERICSICELPPRSCRCKKIGRSGRWFRNGSSIIVNC